MDYATLTKQNQITVPKYVRESLQLKPGDKLYFYGDKKGLSVIKAKGIEALWGFAKPNNKNKKVNPQNVWLERAERWYEKDNS